MNITELRDLLTDATNRIWELSPITDKSYRLSWIHPDAPWESRHDGVYATWTEEEETINLFTEDDLLVYTSKIEELGPKFSIATDYAQMAGGLVKNFPALLNPPSADACQKVVEALYLAEDLEPGFTGSENGVSWWTSNGMVAEYDDLKKAFIVWNEGQYWVSATPAGYVKSLEKAEKDLEQQEFIRLKRELSEK